MKKFRVIEKERDARTVVYYGRELIGEVKTFRGHGVVVYVAFKFTGCYYDKKKIYSAELRTTKKDEAIDALKFKF